MDAIDQCNNYLISGGLFNPEMAIHDNVRDLIVDCRDQMVEQKAIIKTQKAIIKTRDKEIDFLREMIHNAMECLDADDVEGAYDWLDDVISVAVESVDEDK